jgi:hypothetical protein
MQKPSAPNGAKPTAKPRTDQPKPEPPEPDMQFYARTRQNEQTLEIELMDETRLLARILRFGRFSIHVDVLPNAGAADFAGPQVILKHAIRRLRIAPF